MGEMILTRSSVPRETQRTSRITRRLFPKAMILTMMTHRTATITTILSCRMMMQMTAIPMMTMKTTTKKYRRIFQPDPGFQNAAA